MLYNKVFKLTRMDASGKAQATTLLNTLRPGIWKCNLTTFIHSCIHAYMDTVYALE